MRMHLQTVERAREVRVARGAIEPGRDDHRGEALGLVVRGDVPLAVDRASRNHQRPEPDPVPKIEVVGEPLQIVEHLGVLQEERAARADPEAPERGVVARRVGAQ